MKKKYQVTVSAPGKLMLFGEHAVLYGRPCIVTAVDQRMKATVELTKEPVFHLNAPDVQITNYQKPMNELGKRDIPKGAKFVEIAVKNFLQYFVISNPEGVRDLKIKSGDSSLIARNDIRGIRVSTKSEFSSQFGFGSSSASTVCIIKALSELTGVKLSNKAIFQLAYKTILDIQGKGSGFDVAAATYGGTLFYQLKQTPNPIKIPHLPLIVGYSGIKADTVTLINEVSKKAQKFPNIINGIYKSIENIVNEAKKALLRKDWKTLGELMNLNQGYLAALGVGSKKLANMIYAAREAGAYGAKLSGAGGGDCMICIAPPAKVKAIKKAITQAGGEVIEVKSNVEGVRIDG